MSAVIAFIKALPIVRDFVVASKRWYKAVRKQGDDNAFDEAVENKDPKKVAEELGDVL